MFKGLTLLLTALGLFSLFSLKAPKGQQAMSGLAGAAVSTFLVEAIHKYINGGLLQMQFLESVGNASGTMAGVAAAVLTRLSMGVNPIYAVAVGAAVAGYGILPGFIAGYLMGLIAPVLEKRLPQGVGIVLGVLLITPLARAVAVVADPLVAGTLAQIGDMITLAAEQSPLLMGFMLGGIMKVMCTSPLSSMALTAMLGLQGLAMGIASIACVGGSFSNGVIFKKLKLGNNSNIIGVMIEPLTQADVVTANSVPIYAANLLGGGLAGVVAALFGIVNNAPGTASPIPGLIAPLGFNPPLRVLAAAVLAAAGGIIGGLVIASLYKALRHAASRRKPQTLSQQV